MAQTTEAAWTSTPSATTYASSRYAFFIPLSLLRLVGRPSQQQWPQRQTEPADGAEDDPRHEQNGLRDGTARQQRRRGVEHDPDQEGRTNAATPTGSAAAAGGGSRCAVEQSTSSQTNTRDIIGSTSRTWTSNSSTPTTRATCSTTTPAIAVTPTVVATRIAADRGRHRASPVATGTNNPNCTATTTSFADPDHSNAASASPYGAPSAKKTINSTLAISPAMPQADCPPGDTAERCPVRLTQAGGGHESHCAGGAVPNARDVVPTGPGFPRHGVS